MFEMPPRVFEMLLTFCVRSYYDFAGDTGKSWLWSEASAGNSCKAKSFQIFGFALSVVLAHIWYLFSCCVVLISNKGQQSEKNLDYRSVRLLCWPCINYCWDYIIIVKLYQVCLNTKRGIFIVQMRNAHFGRGENRRETLSAKMNVGHSNLQFTQIICSTNFVVTGKVLHFSKYVR